MQHGLELGTHWWFVQVQEAMQEASGILQDLTKKGQSWQNIMLTNSLTPQQVVDGSVSILSPPLHSRFANPNARAVGVLEYSGVCRILRYLLSLAMAKTNYGLHNLAPSEL